MIPFIGALLSTVTGGIVDHFKDRRKIKAAITENKIRLAQDQQSHNQDWELKQLDNAGWKDDFLFYSFMGMFVWAGVDPDGAQEFFKNLQILPSWFVKTWFWLLASILGVKKIGDYAAPLIESIRSAKK